MPEAEREDALAEVTREANRLSRLVADLLALARADAGVPLKHRLLDLDEVVLDAYREARQLSQGQTLTLDPFEPIQVIGDEDRLKQLVLILLDNALKYTPANGHVTLGLQRQETGSKITVRDTGVGIPPEDLPNVFERFYRADPARGRDPGGTGLGLPIARWIVEQHGGKISLESQPGQGAIATVYLPLPCGPSLTPLSIPQHSARPPPDFSNVCHAVIKKEGKTRKMPYVNPVLPGEIYYQVGSAEMTEGEQDEEPTYHIARL